MEEISTLFVAHVGSASGVWEVLSEANVLLTVKDRYGNLIDDMDVTVTADKNIYTGTTIWQTQVATNEKSFKTVNGEIKLDVRGGVRQFCAKGRAGLSTFDFKCK
ncbi:hypothetical protein QUB74_29495 [Microcoleus sp. A2-C2]|uniref:hypothetical protein n=1 Tax=Microcoleus sp. A2-C2 TaxID=2818530 RepID=UPI002FD0F61A